VTLERVSRPALVDEDGKTTIATRVSKTKYLLFESEGIRWKFSGVQSALDEPDYPTLLNGIAWWPLPDKPNTEGWRELMEKTRTPLLKTREFAWAADPNGPKPVVDPADKNASGQLVKVDNTNPREQRLVFTAPDQAGRVMSCKLSRP
jgi:hypothetical protein